MRILVLGASGYLGRHVTAGLRALPGASVLTAGRRPGDDFRVDLGAPAPPGLAAALRHGCDAVVNCAGAVGGTALTQTELNSRAPALLCEAMAEEMPGARLVHLGSAAEYGRTPHGRRVAEDAPAAPVTLYGATKLAGTHAVTGSGLDAVVLRVANPVGAGAPEASLPGRLTAALRREAVAGAGGTVRVGDLSAYRDFVDVRDVARAVRLAVTASGPLPGVLNIGSGRAVRVREFAAALVNTAGFGGRLAEESSAGSARSADVAWQCADIGAAARALTWAPRYALADSLAALWAAAGPVTAPAGPAGQLWHTSGGRP